MSKIRDDLEGVIIVTTEAGPFILRAGDEVPEGVTVGDHVLIGFDGGSLGLLDAMDDDQTPDVESVESDTADDEDGASSEAEPESEDGEQPDEDADDEPTLEAEPESEDQPEAVADPTPKPRGRTKS
jgi:hypothetical protein